jgi:acyl dehydratase
MCPPRPGPDVPFRFTVEQGHVLAFGRAVGDTAPGRVDLAALDARAPVAPTFVAAAGLHDPGPAPFAAGELHAEQHYEYHAPVRVGDVLTVERTDGGAWEKESRRGGRLRFREIRTDYRRPDGTLAVRTRMILVEATP